MARITDYEIVDHGIEYSDYWQGCGTAFTRFQHVATGIGDNYAEALDDCLEMIASGDTCKDQDWEAFNLRMLADERLTEWPTSPRVSERYPGEDSDFATDIFYRISIRYNAG